MKTWQKVALAVVIPGGLLTLGAYLLWKVRLLLDGE